MASVVNSFRFPETSDSDSGTSSIGFDINLPLPIEDDSILTDILSDDTLSFFPSIENGSLPNLLHNDFVRSTFGNDHSLHSKSFIPPLSAQTVDQFLAKIPTSCAPVSSLNSFIQFSDDLHDPNHESRMLKKQERILRNREAANLSRLRKKEYVERLELLLQQLKNENDSLRRVNIAYKDRCDKLQKSFEDFHTKIKAHYSKLGIQSDDKVLKNILDGSESEAVFIDETYSPKSKMAKLVSVGSLPGETHSHNFGKTISISNNVLIQPKPFASASSSLVRSLSRCSQLITNKSTSKVSNLTQSKSQFVILNRNQRLQSVIPSETTAASNPVIITQPPFKTPNKAPTTGRRTINKMNAQMGRQLHAMKNQGTFPSNQASNFSTTSSLFMVVGLLCISLGWIGGSFDLFRSQSLLEDSKLHPNLSE